nr:MAG: replication associated protein [Cressdnaviricota sp.]
MNSPLPLRYDPGAAPPPRAFLVDKQLHFLTYPRCSLPLPDMLRQLKLKYGEKYGWSVISAEDHEPREGDENIGVHRHVNSYCCKRFQTRTARFWDLKGPRDELHAHTDQCTPQLCNYHPNYKPMDAKANTKADVLRYVIKDGTYIVDGMLKDAPFSVEAYLESVKTKGGYGFTYLATEIKAGKTLDELDEVIPGFIANHKRKVDDYIVFQQEKKERQRVRPPFPGFKIPEDPQWAKVARWINLNFLQPREKRQKQLWLWSREPHLGKSWPFDVTLAPFYALYEWAPGPKQGKELLTCQYILFDDFSGGTTVRDLKRLSQMYGINQDIKFGTITRFDKNVPVIVTSNNMARDVYKNVGAGDVLSLEDRFDSIEVWTKCHLELNDPLPPLPLAPLDPLAPNEPLTSQDYNNISSEDLEDVVRIEEDHSEYSNEHNED